MNYKETLDFLYSQLPMYQREGKAAYKADLKNTIALCNLLENPQKNFKSIHIAGTNGKGSVAHLIASILQTAGYKTGLYTSPHLKDFRERIKINGQMIPEEQVVQFVKKHKNNFKKIKPSFFEMTVGLAFKYFSDEKVDIAIIETGMGGRLDSTNIITPYFINHHQYWPRSHPVFGRNPGRHCQRKSRDHQKRSSCYHWRNPDWP